MAVGVRRTGWNRETVGLENAGMAVREGRWTRVRRVRRAREDMNGGIVAVVCVWMKLTVPYDFCIAALIRRTG
jgi:hypothetical protein